MTNTQLGNKLELYVAQELMDRCLDVNARKSKGSGNGTGEKADVNTALMILGQTAGIECKHTAAMSLHTAWKQTKKLETLGREPVLVFKHPEEDFGQTKCVIYFDTLLELVKAVRIGEGVHVPEAKPVQAERDLAYKASRAITELRALSKELAGTDLGYKAKRAMVELKALEKALEETYDH